MIKVEKLTTQPIQGHSAVVFANKQDAEEKDMSQAIGRFDEKRRAIALLTGTALGNKYKALIDNGFQIFLNKDDRNNFYITQVQDAIESLKSGLYSLAMQESIRDVEDGNEEAVELGKVDRQEAGEDKEQPGILEYIEEDEFMKEYIDDAMDLDFTTDTLRYEHRVGLYNEDEQVFTLREDVKEFLKEFTFQVDENEEGVLARVDPASLNGRALLKLIRLLKQQEQDDDERDSEDEMNETLESDRVNISALPIVKSLLARMNLAQKHGDLEESEEAEIELNKLISQYENANPPAAGIDEVKKQRDDILIKKEAQLDEKPSKPSKPSRKQSFNKAVDREASKHSKTYRKAKKVAKSVSNIAKSLKREDEKALTESILEQSGVQIRGQQGYMKYVY
ncbi:TPA: hypothetical protein ACMDRT_001571 [Vibrio parahaemolyticus]